MLHPRQIIGGLGNQLFRHAFLYGLMREGKIPDVYVQDFRYFKEYKEEIKRLYRQGEYVHDPRIAVHFRKGDYNDNSFYIDLTKTDYYDKALRLFKGEKFLVFCADRQGSSDKNDRQICKKFMEERGVEFDMYDGKDEIDDMNMMSSCKGQIIANSTFSVWSAYLNSNPDKKIIAPKDYYTDGIQRTVLPVDEGWIYV